MLVVQSSTLTDPVAFALVEVFQRAVFDERYSHCSPGEDGSGQLVVDASKAVWFAAPIREPSNQFADIVWVLTKAAR